MDETIEKLLRNVVEGSNKDFEWAEEQFNEALQEIEDSERIQVPDDDGSIAAKAAVGAVRTKLNVSSSSFGGESEELPVLALGYSRLREGDYFVTEGDALVGLGIVSPAEDPPGVTTFLLDSADGVSLSHVRKAFDPLTTLRAYVSRSRPSSQIKTKGGKPVYLCNSTEETTLDIVNPDEVDDDDPISELPATREAKRELIHEHFITEEDHVTLDNVRDHVTKVNNNGFEVAFGADVKRFRGQVVDSYADTSTGFGVMTLLDDTVASPDEVSPELVGDRQRTPGLQVFMNPYLVKYGENSVLDVYGFIEETDDGQLRMQGFGSIPLVEFAREDGGGGSNDDVEEETI